MFTIENTIDTVKNGTLSLTDSIQKGKKQFVTTFVTNSDYAKTMNDFVDAQTEYTNNAINAGFESAKTMVKNTADFMQDSMQYLQPIKIK